MKLKETMKYPWKLMNGYDQEIWLVELKIVEQGLMVVVQVALEETIVVSLPVAFPSDDSCLQDLRDAEKEREG